MTADNNVVSVKLMKENGQLITLDVQGALGTWEEAKTVNFHPGDNDEKGALVIQASDGYANQDHCKMAGFILHCEATDTTSPWHNFVSHKYWRSEDSKNLCSDSEAPFLGFNKAFINTMLNVGAKNVWVDGNKEVTLTGSPWSNGIFGFKYL